MADGTIWNLKGLLHGRMGRELGRELFEGLVVGEESDRPHHSGELSSFKFATPRLTRSAHLVSLRTNQTTGRRATEQASERASANKRNSPPPSSAREQTDRRDCENALTPVASLSLAFACRRAGRRAQASKRRRLHFALPLPCLPFASKAVRRRTCRLARRVPLRVKRENQFQTAIWVDLQISLGRGWREQANSRTHMAASSARAARAACRAKMPARKFTTRFAPHGLVLRRRQALVLLASNQYFVTKFARRPVIVIVCCITFII